MRSGTAVEAEIVTINTGIEGGSGHSGKNPGPEKDVATDGGTRSEGKIGMPSWKTPEHVTAGLAPHGAGPAFLRPLSPDLGRLSQTPTCNTLCRDVPPMTDSDPDLTKTYILVRRAKEGQKEALGRLFDRYYERVRKIVHLRLGDKLRGLMDSDDILQDTFINAIKSFDRFEMRNEASVINWLSRIAERAIMRQAQHFRAEKRNAKQVPIDELDSQDLGIQIADGQRGPGTSMARREQAQTIEACIQELPEQYREIIVLRNYVEYSWEEVAKEHGRPSVDAARMMHAKAMVELNRMWKEKTGESSTSLD